MHMNLLYIALLIHYTGKLHRYDILEFSEVIYDAI